MKTIELHMIQSVPSSNINRGEDGDCKTSIVGGVERQRISSQAWKRPMRMMVQEDAIKNGDPSGLISKVFGDQIINALVAKGEPPENAKMYVSKLGIGYTDESDESDESDDKAALMYMTPNEIHAVVDAYSTFKEKLNKLTIKKSKPVLGDILTDSACRISSDIALFGRMFASAQTLNVYGAVKMNHALSTHGIEMEDDYFTAVDQLNPNGAGHLGNSSYTSSTMYRYVCIDVEQLKRNLGEHGDVNATIKTFIKAAITAFPKGKENVMAAYSRPSYVNVVVKNGQPFTFAGAFENPVKSSNSGYEVSSREAMEAFRDAEYSKGWDDILLNTELKSVGDIDVVINAIGE